MTSRTARRRDGQQCEAPAVPWTLVCRRHGGSAPQVLVKARHLELQAVLYDATTDYREAKGTKGEFDALCKASAASRDLDEYEAKLQQLAELRAKLRRIKAAAKRTTSDRAPSEQPSSRGYTGGTR